MCEYDRNKMLKELSILGAIDPAVITIKVPDNVEVDKVIAQEHKIHTSCSDTVVGAKACLICGESIPVYGIDYMPEVCDSCKKAVKYIRKTFKTVLKSFDEE